MCLICKLHFINGYVCIGKNVENSAKHDLWFWASAGGLGKYPQWIKGNHCKVKFISAQVCGTERAQQPCLFCHYLTVDRNKPKEKDPCWTNLNYNPRTVTSWLRNCEVLGSSLYWGIHSFLTTVSPAAHKCAPSQGRCCHRGVGATGIQ
jgi:hypothetical protein